MKALLLLFLSATLACAAESDSLQSIPIHFTLKEPGFVTLVIEDAGGRRVRNLISETPFPAGDNVARWDGRDDLGRDPDAASHGVYYIPAKFVAPGRYQARGLVRPEINLVYEMTPYSHGNPPWATKDKASEWLANHTPPSAVAFIPENQAPARECHPAPGGQIIVGSEVSEGGSGVAWLNLQGDKVHGQLWIGGAWTGASQLAHDDGDHPVEGAYAYTCSAWEGELRLYSLSDPARAANPPADARFGTGEDHPVLDPKWKFPDKALTAIGGLAVRNGLVVVSLSKMDQLLMIDSAAKKVGGMAALKDPRGLAFDSRGRLLALCGQTLLRFTLGRDPSQLGTPETLIAKGLEDPRQVALDAQGNIYVSDRGGSNQVKVFSPDGQFTHTIGVAGGVTVGPYNPEHMDYPNGIAISGDGHLWVAETSKCPKRISVWTLDGKLVNAFYGPTQYGGGGTIDPEDPTRYFYGDEGGGQEWKLDWNTGTARPVGIYYRPELSPIQSWNHIPQTPFHVNGKTYLTDCFTSSPTEGSSAGGLWILENEVARPVALVGQANDSLLFGMTGPYSIRWTGKIQPQFSETYTFQEDVDGGARVWVNGQLLIDDWEMERGGKARVNSGTIALEAAKSCDIRVEYHHQDGRGFAHLYWSSQSQRREAISATAYGAGLQGDYFDGANFEKHAATHTDSNIDCVWNNSLPDAMFSDRTRALRAALPPGTDLNHDRIVFAWSDLNDDGQIEPDEIIFRKGDVGSVMWLPDLSVITASGMVFTPAKITAKGAPVFDAAQATVSPFDWQPRVSTGGGQALMGRDGRLVLTTAPKPFSPCGIGGVENGAPAWSYPSPWPGLHASHIAPLPEFPGELIGTTRLLGPTISPRGSDAGEIWAINGNKGNIYLLTTDGLFVATLFKDCRGHGFDAPEAKRGMLMNDLSTNEECFWPSITQVADGRVYMQVASVGSIVRVEGLEGIRRLTAGAVEVTTSWLQAAQTSALQSEMRRQQGASVKMEPLAVAIRSHPMVVNGRLDDWAGAAWALIDSRLTQEGDWGKRQKKTEGAVAISQDKLYAAFKTDDPDLLNNSGESPQNLFKTGGCLDLMIGAPSGGERLLISRVKGKTVAVLYRPNAPGATTEPILFQSPIRTVKFDRVDDVSDQVVLASGVENDPEDKTRTTIYEVSCPLTLLGLNPHPGQTIQGDIGILRGNGFQTLQRVYWHNKATGLVSDLPSEVELTPQLWGDWQFEAAP